MLTKAQHDLSIGPSLLFKHYDAVNISTESIGEFMIDNLTEICFKFFNHVCLTIVPIQIINLN